VTTPVPDYQALLNSVRTAIAEILLHGQSNAFNGQTKSRADLSSLRELDVYYASLVRTEGQTQKGKGRNKLIYVVPEA
jgi:hypothetical protein